jgi:hypothetical protein
MNKYAMAIIKIPVEFLQDGTIKQYPELYELEMAPIENLPLPKETPPNNIVDALSNMIPIEPEEQSPYEPHVKEEDPFPKKPHIHSLVKTFKNHMKSIRNYTQKRRTNGTSSNGTSSNGTSCNGTSSNDAMGVDSIPQSTD